MQDTDRTDRGMKISAWLWGVAVAGTGAALVILYRSPDFAFRFLLEKLLFAGWTLGPPIWFILQYRVWPPRPDQLDRYRLQQGLLKAVWAGVAAFLAAIFFGRWPG